MLLPALDDAKHYWVAPDEVEKLLRAGEGWLAGHPERALVTRRYLAHRRALAGEALARLAERRLEDEAADPDSVDAPARLAAGEPLWRVHEPVFAVLASESEPVDPRL